MNELSNLAMDRIEHLVNMQAAAQQRGDLKTLEVLHSSAIDLIASLDTEDYEFLTLDTSILDAE